MVLIGLREVMTMSNETLIINIVVVVAIVSVLVILDAFSGGQLFFGNGVF